MPTTVHPKSTSPVLFFFSSFFSFSFRVLSLISLTLPSVARRGYRNVTLATSTGFQKMLSVNVHGRMTRADNASTRKLPRFLFPLPYGTLSHSSLGSLPWGRCFLVKSWLSSARTRTVSVTGQVELLSLSNDPCQRSISPLEMKNGTCCATHPQPFGAFMSGSSARMIFLFGMPVFQQPSILRVRRKILPLNADGTVFYRCWCGCQAFFADRTMFL